MYEKDVVGFYPNDEKGVIKPGGMVYFVGAGGVI